MYAIFGPNTTLAPPIIVPDHGSAVAHVTRTMMDLAAQGVRAESRDSFPNGTTAMHLSDGRHIIVDPYPTQGDD